MYKKLNKCEFKYQNTGLQYMHDFYYRNNGPTYKKNKK